MGTLTYDSTITAEFDDRTLTHLQVVIWSKLRRGEHFAFTFGDESPPAQRTSVWCSPTIPMAFRFEQAEPPELNTRVAGAAHQVGQFGRGPAAGAGAGGRTRERMPQHDAERTRRRAMGLLIYGARVSEFDIEDRVLAHLQFVVATKLRRGEQFMLTWNHGVERGSGRSSIWISPYVPVHFKYHGNRPPKLNRAGSS